MITERKNECEFCDEIFAKDKCYREHLKTHLIEWKEKSTRLRRPRGYVNVRMVMVGEFFSLSDKI